MNGWFTAWIICMIISGIIHLIESDDASEWIIRMIYAAIGWVIILGIVRVIIWFFTG